MACSLLTTHYSLFAIRLRYSPRGRTSMNAPNAQTRLPGTEHWTSKGDVKLFLWNKVAEDPARTKGTILFVHGSSMASQPTFDLDVPGRPDSSAMEYFARAGYDSWCVDM